MAPEELKDFQDQSWHLAMLGKTVECWVWSYVEDEAVSCQLYLTQENKLCLQFFSKKYNVEDAEWLEDKARIQPTKKMACVRRLQELNEQLEKFQRLERTGPSHHKKLFILQQEKIQKDILSLQARIEKE